MIVLVGIIGLFLSISLHEIGHALKMKKHGICMREICLFGLGGPALVRFKVPRLFGQTPITIRPLIPIGAFVRPETEDGVYEDATTLQKVDIAAAGVVVNLYMGFGIFAGVGIFYGYWKFLAVNIAVLIFIFLAFRYFKTWFFIVTGVIFMGVLAYTIFRDISNVGSVVTIVKFVVAQQTIKDAIVTTAAISVSIGLFNCMPLFGLDGHKILETVLPERARAPVDVVGAVLMILLAVIAFGNDIISLF